MFGPKVHLFAAAIAFAVGGASGASAGLLDNGRCCAPTTWGCQSTCANIPNVIYGTLPAPAPAYYPPPVYPVNQGPTYEPPLLPYGEPGYAPEGAPGPYPYVAPYGGYGFPYYGPGYRRHGYPGFRRYGVPGFRGFRPGFRTAMHPNRFVGYRPMVRTPFVRRAPMVRSKRW